MALAMTWGGARTMKRKKKCCTPRGAGTTAAPSTGSLLTFAVAFGSRLASRKLWPTVSTMSGKASA
eukprot:3127519-Alexandrium_andersonii.AAC.1